MNKKDFFHVFEVGYTESVEGESFELKKIGVVGIQIVKKLFLLK